MRIREYFDEITTFEAIFRTITEEDLKNRLPDMQMIVRLQAAHCKHRHLPAKMIEEFEELALTYATSLRFVFILSLQIRKSTIQSQNRLPWADIISAEENQRIRQKLKK